MKSEDIPAFQGYSWFQTRASLPQFPHDIDIKELSRDKTKIDPEGRQMTFSTTVALYPDLSVFSNNQVVE